MYHLDISQLGQYSSLSDRGAQYGKETHFAIPSRNIYIPRAIEFVRWLCLQPFCTVRLKVYSFQKTDEIIRQLIDRKFNKRLER